MVRATLALLLLAQGDLERRRDALVSKLEELRGLKFKTPLGIREGSRKEYAEFALENARRVYGEDLQAAEKGFKALGLLPAKLRLDVAISAQAGLGVKAWCTHGELLLLDRAADGEWLISKMDLGLVDQHFAPAVASTVDARMAFAALRMGDAEVAKLLYRHAGALPPELPRRAAEEAEAWEKGDSSLASSIVPRLFVRMGEFPWRRGAAFALALQAAGGRTALDKAFQAPPVSTQQILHPDRYVQGSAPTVLDLTGAEAFLKEKGYLPLYGTVLGELGAALVLETHFPREDVSAASEGWRGDTFRVFQKDGAPALVLWATEWAREEDAVRFQSFGLKIAVKLVGADPGLLAPVLRHRTSVAFLVNVPKELQDPCLDRVWTSKRIRGTKTDVFGE